MRVVLQRVERAEAFLDGQSVAAIGAGLVAFVGFGREDGPEVVERLAHKAANLRVFEEGDSKFGRSLLDVGGEVLLVSQFTVMADTRRGRRPNFSRAAPIELAAELYALLADCLRSAGVRVAAGPFQARLVVDVRNWGPFTLTLDSERR